MLAKIGERKGMLTVIVEPRFYSATASHSSYLEQLTAIGNGPIFGDSWPVHLGAFDADPNSRSYGELGAIVQDSAHRVITYLSHIDALWDLGSKPFRPSYAGDLNEREGGSQQSGFNPKDWEELT